MTTLFHDFESFSECDLPKSGVSRYVRHPSTEVLMLAYAFDDGPVRQWLPAEGQPMPSELRDAMRDPGVIKRAWNSGFEWNVWTHVLGVETPIEQWRCTMVHALTLSLPGSLAKAGEIVGLPDDKKKLSEGKRLVKLFCTPRKPTKTKLHTRATAATDPAKWQTFLDYNTNDVEAERAIYHKIRKWDLPEYEWENWHMDREINERGIPINMDVVAGALQIADEVIRDRMAQMREITGLDNPNSGVQLLPWLQARGYPFADLKSGHIKKAIEQKLYSGNDVAVVLRLRQETSKSSVKKYAALDNAVCDDGLLRNTLQFAGAGRTWREAGRIYQPQNLPRPAKHLEKAETQAELVKDIAVGDARGLEWMYGSPMDALSTALRPVVQAGEGRVIVSADLNAIENRGVGWIAGDQKILDVFRKGLCPYLSFAVFMFGQRYADLAAEYDEGRGNKTKRTKAKAPVLGCAYALSGGEEKEDERTGETIATGLLGYAWNMGIMLTLEEASQFVKIWRDTYSDVVQFWYELTEAFMYTIRTEKSRKVGPLKFDKSGPFVRMHLPSGHALHYLRAKIEPRKTPWGAIRDTITYEGLDLRKQWVRIATHGGKILENATQAICRDLLFLGLRRAIARGVDIRLHIHDEIVGLSLANCADKWLRILIESMTEPAPWAPDFPLGAAGSISPIFIKD